MTDPRIEAAAVACYVAVQPSHRKPEGWEGVPRVWKKSYRDQATAALAAADKAATIDPGVAHFINERPGYIAALKGTRGTDDQSDYHRWQGHAEARRQLATILGYTVPRDPEELTERCTE